MVDHDRGLRLVGGDSDGKRRLARTHQIIHARVKRQPVQAGGGDKEALASALPARPSLILGLVQRVEDLLLLGGVLDVRGEQALRALRLGQPHGSPRAYSEAISASSSASVSGLTRSR